MSKHLNLIEMAARLRKTPKTFRKYVQEYQIPHIRLGRSYLFDADKVELYLETIQKSEASTLPQRDNVRSFIRPVTKYAKRLGL